MNDQQKPSGGAKPPMGFEAAMNVKARELMCRYAGYVEKRGHELEEIQINSFVDGANWAKAHLLEQRKGYDEAANDLLFALQCLIILRNGSVPGMTEQQVFDGAVVARENFKQIRDALAKLKAMGVGE